MLSMYQQVITLDRRKKNEQNNSQSLCDSCTEQESGGCEGIGKEIL